ncbi:MAG: DUF2164 domain-containing protein [Planctomycetota bacterium]|nr:DUF2164 domain-containing protein [Planctomycetota bacterium]
MSIRLDPDRRALLLNELKALYAESFDQELSDFRASELLEFFLKRLGPTVYNQGVQDARKFMYEKLEDLEGEVRIDGELG